MVFKNRSFLICGLSAALAICFGFAVKAQAQPVQDSLTVSGDASYLQRIAMPPEAVLTVQLQDVSRADARAIVLAESRQVFGNRQVPLAYSVTVMRSAINPGLHYVVRASISVDGQIKFSTTRQYPVLTRGAPGKVNLLLSAVSEAGKPHVPSTFTSEPLPGVVLPATFAGVLPCADCLGIANTLTLQPDGSYRLRRTYLGKPAGSVLPVESMTETGRWTADHKGKRIALQNSADKIIQPLYFSVLANDKLRQLDSQGQAIKTSANTDLGRTAKLDPVHERPLTQPVTSVEDNTGSASDNAGTTLQDTYWKLVELKGQPVVMLPGQEREVRITLARQDQRLMGFSGCNALGGTYRQNGASLNFGQLASSMRLCEPSLNALERQVLDALIATTGQRIEGKQLSLTGGTQVLARFEAVYLK